MPTDPLPVVVATDLSAPAAEALACARRVAAATGATLHLLHVAPVGADVPEREAALAAWAGASDVRVVRAVRTDDAPGLAVHDYARRVGAALVVMGADELRARRRPLGAVASDVLHMAPCDVLLVPWRPEAPASSAPWSRVLAAVDMSATAAPLASFAAGVARALGAVGVDLVHVLEPLPHPVRWTDERLLALLPAVRERAEAALRELAAGLPALDGLDVALYVEHGKAAPTVPRVAEALGDALVVVGLHADAVRADRLLGSTAEGIARRATCPVLVARHSARPEALGA